MADKPERSSGSGDRRVEWLGAIGVIALLLGGYFAFVALRGDGDTRDEAPPMTTTAFVSKSGGFSVRVPSGMTGRRTGSTARFSTDDKQLVVTVGRSTRGTVKATSATLVKQLRAAYPAVSVLGRRTAKVDGRAALQTYGRAATSKGTKLRFVVLVVKASPRNYVLTTFAAAGADPDRVLPVVDRLANSFHVRQAS